MKIRIVLNQFTLNIEAAGELLVLETGDFDPTAILEDPSGEPPCEGTGEDFRPSFTANSYSPLVDVCLVTPKVHNK